MVRNGFRPSTVSDTPGSRKEEPAPLEKKTREKHGLLQVASLHLTGDFFQDGLTRPVKETQG